MKTEQCYVNHMCKSSDFKENGGKYSWRKDNASWRKSYSLLMNTNISVTGDRNTRQRSYIPKDSTNIKSIDSYSVLKCNEKSKMVEHRTEGSANRSKHWEPRGCGGEKQKAFRHCEVDVLKDESTVGRNKRVLSPRNETSSNKRSRGNSPRNNMLSSNYLYYNDQIDCLPRDSVSGSSVPEVWNLQNDKESLTPEIIVVSSDEESYDSDCIFEKHEFHDKITNNVASSETFKCTSKESIDFDVKKSSVSSTKRHYEIDEIYFISDEEEIPGAKPCEIVDLTFDDDGYALDENGGIVVTNPKQRNSNENFNSDDGSDSCEIVDFKSQKKLLSPKKSGNHSHGQNVSRLQRLEDNGASRFCVKSTSAMTGSNESLSVHKKIVSQQNLSTPSNKLSKAKEHDSEIDSFHSDVLESGKNVKNAYHEVQDGYESDTSCTADSLPQPPTFGYEYQEKYGMTVPSIGIKKMELKKSKGNSEKQCQNEFNSCISKIYCETSTPTTICNIRRSSSDEKCFQRCISSSSDGNDSETEILEKEEEEEEDEVAEDLNLENCFTSKTVRPSATQVCQAQAEVLGAKLYRPWIELNSSYVPNCCMLGPTECYNLHGRKEKNCEEGDFTDDNLVLKMDSGLSAINLLQNRIDCVTYPTSTTVQYVLMCCMDIWEEGISDVFFWLRQLLELHPPCAYGMLKYYKKILFSPAQNMDMGDGMFWNCITRIEENMNSTQKASPIRQESVAPINQEVALQNLEEYFKKACSSAEEAPVKAASEKLENVFRVLKYLIEVMEADLNIGLLRNITNLKRYVCKAGKPLMALAVWGDSFNVGKMNHRCKHIIKLYFKMFETYHLTEPFECFQRLISLIAGVVYASEQNTEPPKFPNVETNCKEFTSVFATEMMALVSLNMKDVPVLLSSLNPEWLRVSVCIALIEKLCGRVVGLSLQPLLVLLKSVCAANRCLPSPEEIANTAIGSFDTPNETTQELQEVPQVFIKSALKKDKRGETRLHVACRRNNLTQVEKLLGVANINVNEKDNFGWTPLHEAALHGSTDCVRKLLNYQNSFGNHPIDLRAKNKVGITPLMDAVTKNRLDIAKELLQYGGRDLLLDQTNDGRCAMDFAVTKEMQQVLKNAEDFNKIMHLVGIPRSLFIKLTVLLPLAITSYVKFSEVMKIAQKLRVKCKLTKPEEPSTIKFQPLLFKQDFTDFKNLQSFLTESLGKDKLLDPLACLVLQ